MRAIICTQLGEPEDLVLGEAASEALEPGQVRLRVAAAGVNFPDTLIIRGRYQLRPPLPFIPGFEVAGRVIEIGPDVRGHRVGDRLMGLTSHGYGGFADEAILDADRAIPVPSSIDDVTAASMVAAYGTAYHALVQRGAGREGQTLFVSGAAGGVGLAAIQIGKALGMRVIAAAGSQDKLAVAAAHGAAHLIDYTQEDLKTRLRGFAGDSGVDVALDTVGGDVFDTLARCMAWDGRLLVVGFTSGRIPLFPVNLALLKGYQLVGVYWGVFAERDPLCNRDNFERLFELVAAGRIRPAASATYPLEQTPRALMDLMSRKCTGKLVVTMAG